MDCTTNEPNVFFDPKAKVATFPIHSKGTTDFKAQRSAIIATELKWKDSDMIGNKFLWCWDARPYPFWPDYFRIWKDGGSWQKGHWVQGKIGHSTLAGVLEYICHRSGLSPYHYECENLDENMDGLLVDSRTSGRSLIELLNKAYKFDSIEKDGRVTFRNSKNQTPIHIPIDDLVYQHRQPIITICRTQELELPHKVDVNYVDIAKNYQVSNQHSMSSSTFSMQKETIDLPLVLSQGNARVIAENYLHHLWTGRISYSFTLTAKYIYLTPGDLVSIDYEGSKHEIKIISIQLGKNNVLKIDGISHKTRKHLSNDYDAIKGSSESIVFSDTEVEILDLPHLKGNDLDKCYVTLVGKNSTDGETKGATIFATTTHGYGYKPVAEVSKLATYGKILSGFSEEDDPDKLVLNLENGELISISEDAIKAGANLCIIGNEVIQFRNARLIDFQQYELSGLIRGLASTEEFINSHQNGDRFIMLNDDVVTLELPAHYVNTTLYFKAVSRGKTLGETKEEEFSYAGNSRKPFSPIDLEVTITEDNRILTWKRRNRKFTDYADYNQLPQEEGEEKYIVEEFDHNNDLIHSFYAVGISACTLLDGTHSVSVAQISKIGVKGFEARKKVMN